MKNYMVRDPRGRIEYMEEEDIEDLIRTWIREGFIHESFSDVKSNLSTHKVVCILVDKDKLSVFQVRKLTTLEVRILEYKDKYATHDLTLSEEALFIIDFAIGMLLELAIETEAKGEILAMFMFQKPMQIEKAAIFAVRKQIAKIMEDYNVRDIIGYRYHDNIITECNVTNRNTTSNRDRRVGGRNSKVPRRKRTSK